MKKVTLVFLSMVFISLQISCGGDSEKADEKSSSGEFKLDYTVHKMSEKVKWLTNNREPLVASPEAKKGGTFHGYISTFPLTFRVVGPDSNNFTRSYFTNNQMSLLSYHANTDKLLPELATHWAYGKDGKTMYFKLDPNARWSDGKPVTGDDFIYTLEFMRSKHIRAPWYNDYYTKEIESVKKYEGGIISVTATKKMPELWNTLGISPTPKHFYGVLDEDFVKKYNWKVAPNTGPYILKDYSKGKYLLFERKKNWWAQNYRYFKNRYNVDFYKLTVIREENVAFEYFRKGKLDTFSATRPAIWHEKAKGEIFQRGYVQKLWFYNDSRRPTWGLYLNLDKAIFKDKRVRYALAHAINFKKINRQIMRNETRRLNTFFSGYGKYTNRKIKAREFNLKKVSRYMKDAGWKRGADGIWEKNGQKFSVTLTYGRALFTPRVVVMKEEAKKAGIELNLEQLDPSTSYKKIMEKKHDIAYLGWSTNLRPAPWQSFHSDNAHKPQTNNINNMDDPEMDKLIDKYRKSMKIKERIELSHAIQERIHQSGAWIPLEMVNFTRALHWRWVKFPKVPGFKMTTNFFSYPSAGGFFWIDKEVKEETLNAMKKGKSFKPVTRIIKKYK